MRRRIAFLALFLTSAVLLRQVAPAGAVSYPAGWNLVSGPTGSTLSGASGFLYTLQPGDSDYEQLAASAPLKGGYGYWAYFPSGGSLVPGQDAGAYSVTLTPGQWTMLGNPSATGSASIAGADTVLNYAPDAGYQQATALAPGQGAWVLGAGTVSLTATVAPSLQLLESLAPGVASSHPLLASGGLPTNTFWYVFRAVGVDLQTTPTTGRNALSGQPPLTIAGWGTPFVDRNLVVVFVQPSVPPGTYAVTLALINGTTLTGSFQHPPGTAASPGTAAPAGSGAAGLLSTGQVAYDVGAGVPSDDQDTIRAAIDVGKQSFGAVGDVTVHVYTDLDALLRVYAQAVCGGCTLDANTRQRWMTTGEAETFLGHIFLYVGTAQWRGWTPTQRTHEVVHEYFHAYQNAAFGRRILASSAGGDYAAGPVWLIEGSAEYEAYVATDTAGVQSLSDGRLIEQNRAQSIALPLSAMETWQQPSAMQQTDGPYALGFFATQELASIAGTESVKRYWAQVQSTSRWQDAFTATFGLSVDAFYTRFPGYLAAQIALPPPSLSFIGVVPTSTVSGFPPGGTLYAFSLVGAGDVLGAGSVNVVSAGGAVVSTSWARLDAQRIAVYLSAGTPAGTYTAVVTLPNGQTLRADFQHAGG